VLVLSNPHALAAVASVLASAAAAAVAAGLALENGASNASLPMPARVGDLRGDFGVSAPTEVTVARRASDPAAGPLITSTRYGIGRARMNFLQDECTYRRAEEEEEEEEEEKEEEEEEEEEKEEEEEEKEENEEEEEADIRRRSRSCSQ